MSENIAGLQVLLVEDDRAIANVIRMELEHCGHQVSTAFDGRTGLQLCLDSDWDIVLLDVMLPFLDGYEICKNLRSSKDTPVLMLTAKDHVDNKVLGLDLGADDYLTKPFAMKELLARIYAIVRRHKGFNAELNRLKFGELELDLNSHRCYFKGDSIELTKTEFDLLELFMRHPNHVFTRDKIMENVWGYDFYGDSNVVDVYLRFLRNKIDKPFGIKYFHTVRGVGYVLRHECNG